MDVIGRSYMLITFRSSKANISVLQLKTYTETQSRTCTYSPTLLIDWKKSWNLKIFSNVSYKPIKFPYIEFPEH